MKIRLPLFWVQMLLALSALQTVPAQSVGNWRDVMNSWENATRFELSANIIISHQTDGTADDLSVELSGGRTVTVNGDDGKNGRYSLGQSGLIIRQSALARPFIVDNGTLILNNLQFNRLFEQNEGRDLTGEIPNGGARSVGGGGIPLVFYACGAAVYSKAETAVTQITNCSFDGNYIVWSLPYTRTNADPEVESTINRVARVFGGAAGGLGQFTILFSRFTGNVTSGTISMNDVEVQANGGALWASHLLIGNSEFSNNRATAREEYVGTSADYAPETHVTARGGAIVSESNGGAINIAGCHFSGNYALANTVLPGTVTVYHMNEATAIGGAVVVSGGDNAEVSYCTFVNNYASAKGIEARAQGGAASFTLPGFVVGCTFTGNYALATALEQSNQIQENPSASAWGGAAIGGHFDDCTFNGNYAEARDPAVTVNGMVIQRGTAAALGGALYTTSSVIKNSSFLDNYVMAADSSKGGAIYLTPEDGAFSLDIIADRKNSLFGGNKINVIKDNQGNILSGLANAIYIDAPVLSENSTFDLRAASGLSVQFYDPIIVNAPAGGAAGVELSFNRPGGSGSVSYDGSIIFRGNPELSEEASVDNYVSAVSSSVAMHQYGGEVVIMDDAVLGAAIREGEESLSIGAKSYDMDKGALEMTTNGHLMASQMQFGGMSSEIAACTFRNGTGAQMTAESISINNGLTVDFRPFLDSHDSGTILNTGALSLNGVLKVADKGAGYLEFYLNKRWASNQDYMVFSLSDEALAGKTGDFSSILSVLTGRKEVPASYGYNGRWEMEWRGNELFACWIVDSNPNPGPDPDPDPNPNPTPDPDPNPGPGPNPNPPATPQIHPELAGALVLDSLWSTESNMKSFSNSALAQLGLSRYKIGKDTHYWASGLGDFSSHRSQGAADGYRYDGFGYSIGADRLFREKNLVTGLAFGNLFGTNKSRNYSAEIDQTSCMGMIYSGWMDQINEDTILNVSGSVSYGQTANELKTYYSDALDGQGKWDNNAWRLTLKAEWTRVLNDSWAVTPYIGLEYDDVTGDAFQETGSRVRQFGKSTLRNLALPAGISVNHQADCFDGMKWSNNFTVSYVPDAYRKNPETSAILLSQDYAWTARGIKPLRNAVRVEYATRLQLNASCSLFAGYSLEGRKNSVYQGVNAGISVSF